MNFLFVIVRRAMAPVLLVMIALALPCAAGAAQSATDTLHWGAGKIICRDGDTRDWPPSKGLPDSSAMRLACAGPAPAKMPSGVVPGLGTGPEFAPGSAVTEEEYRATQERMRAAGVEKQREGRIRAARNGSLGAIGAIKTAWATGDRSLQYYLAGKYFGFLVIALIALRLLFR